jgi:signal transduction histidine kinase
MAQVGLASTLTLWMSGRLAWSLMTGASAPVVESRINGMVGVAGSVVTVLCFTGPLGFLSGLFEQLPTQRGARPTHLLQGTKSELNASVDSTQAIVSLRPTTTRPIRVISFGVLWIAYVIGTPWLHGSPTWTPLSVGGFAGLRILLLPSLLGLVYYHARFVFFDVLVKQGVVWGSLALILTVLTFGAASAVLSHEVGAAIGLVCVGATLLVGACVGLMKRGNQWLDRILFQRPDYRVELQVIATAMTRCTNRRALTDTATSHLERTLRAGFVRYDREAAISSDVVVGLGIPERPRGFLTLGPRIRGQQYGSEDLTFIDAVAAQLSGHLEAFDARDSAQLAATAELKALRAQINPHFLFNALSMLAEMSRGQPEAERTILNLSQVFRYALESTQHESVPLGSEIDAIRAYLEIEAERFEELLHFEIDVPDDVRDLRVPPMLLQPLVENAVTHGLSSKVGGGTLRIRAARDGCHVRITVQDDGVGFDLERTPQRIGLANVGARVERTGGSCRVQSIPGAGTLITVALVTS